MKRVALVALALCACGEPGKLGRSAVAPADVTVHVPIEDVPVSGAEVTIVRVDESKTTGELLEATEDHITLLEGTTIVTIETTDVRRVILTRYANGTLIGVLAVWSAVGGLATLSHGLFLIFTGPIWGAISTGAIVPVAADEARFAYADKKSDLTFLHEYARFPQGLPPQYKKKHER
jgi:hypothetical protein